MDEAVNACIMTPTRKTKTARKARPMKAKGGACVAHQPCEAYPDRGATTAEIIEMGEELVPSAGVATSPGLWAKVHTQWMLGDWNSIASLDLRLIEHDPRRAELATLAACACWQSGDKQAARKLLAAASRWHCAPAFMVRALVASSEACLARYHQAAGRDEKAAGFLASSAGAFGGDGALAAAARQALQAEAHKATESTNGPCGTALHSA